VAAGKVQLGDRHHSQRADAVQHGFQSVLGHCLLLGDLGMTLKLHAVAHVDEHGVDSLLRKKTDQLVVFFPINGDLLDPIASDLLGPTEGTEGL
jgi:hypothetical protein